MNLNDVAVEARKIKLEHGFDIVEETDWNDNSHIIGAKLNGIHVEITEMFQNESEDNFIAVGTKGRWEIEREIRNKMAYNQNRPIQHGEKRG